MKKLGIFVLLLILVVGVSGCTESGTSGATNQDLQTGNTVYTPDTQSSKEIAIEKLEIYHFHGNTQCTTCRAVGDYAEETVNTYFKDELEKGIIVFDHINAELPENYELAKKYGVTGSSLWLGTYDKDGNFKAEQNTNVWYKTSDKEEYMYYFKGVIESKLEGN